MKKENNNTNSLTCPYCGHNGLTKAGWVYANSKKDHKVQRYFCKNKDCRKYTIIPEIQITMFPKEYEDHFPKGVFGGRKGSGLSYKESRIVKDVTPVTKKKVKHGK